MCYRKKNDWHRVDESSWKSIESGERLVQEERVLEVLEITNRLICVVSTAWSQFFRLLARVVLAMDFRSALQRCRNTSADIFRTYMAFEFGLLHQL